MRFDEIVRKGVKEMAAIILSRGKKFVLTLMIAALLLVSNVSAHGDNKLQFYFSPQMLHDISGEVIIDVNMRNFDMNVSDNLGELCGVTFSCEFPEEQFEVKSTDGIPVVQTDEQTLIASESDIEVKRYGNKLMFTFMDSTLMDNLIDKDGTLFRFTLIARNSKNIWDSTNYYPIRFVPGSIGVVTYNLSNYSVGRFYGAEGIDGKVGGYNVPPTLVSPSIGKRLTFTEDSFELNVDGTVMAMDVPAVSYNGHLMVPVRFFAESIGMRVEWNNEVMTASAYADYKTMKISMTDSAFYVNAARCSASTAPIERNGRIYVSADMVQALYPNAEVSVTEGTMSIYIP